MANEYMTNGSYPSPNAYMPSTNTFNNAFIDNEGNIITWDMNSGNRVIGITTAMYSKVKEQLIQAIDKAEEYYKMLVDHGIIKSEPTQAEVLAEAMKQLEETKAQNKQLTDMIQNLTTIIQTSSLSKTGKESESFLQPVEVPEEVNGN